jgi:hypothetical protein
MRRRAWRIVLVLAVGALGSGCARAADVRPECGGEDDDVFILAAQAVPSATLLPCIDPLRTGWAFAGSQIVDGAFRFWLDSDRAGIQAVEVELLAECDVTGGIEVTPSADESGTRRFEDPISLSPTYAADRFYTFPGGCVKVQYRFGIPESTLTLEADQAISFRPRQEFVDRLAELGLVLCGAGAPACPGGD